MSTLLHYSTGVGHILQLETPLPTTKVLKCTIVLNYSVKTNKLIAFYVLF